MIVGFFRKKVILGWLLNVKYIEERALGGGHEYAENRNSHAFLKLSIDTRGNVQYDTLMPLAPGKGKLTPGASIRGCTRAGWNAIFELVSCLRQMWAEQSRVHCKTVEELRDVF